MKAFIKTAVLALTLAACASTDARLAKPAADARKVLEAAQPVLVACPLLGDAKAVKACEDVREAVKRLLAVVNDVAPVADESDAGKE